MFGKRPPSSSSSSNQVLRLATPGAPSVGASTDRVAVKPVVQPIPFSSKSGVAASSPPPAAAAAAAAAENRNGDNEQIKNVLLNALIDTMDLSRLAQLDPQSGR